ncbi:hypothetical protein AVEN_244273-1 [Araneus ventricosus]|uniref:Uncharacterized protein n=1 Tax=Araneus ventricosus TaxID=182803 RepID=A0A4Y2PNS0_ARAVE|nr:hypothetical protein AVEN_244273-1 [Araneus ventricosus]
MEWPISPPFHRESDFPSVRQNDVQFHPALEELIDGAIIACVMICGGHLLLRLLWLLGMATTEKETNHSTFVSKTNNQRNSENALMFFKWQIMKKKQFN